MTDRDQLLELVEGLRAEMNARLDALAAAIRQGSQKPSRKRRAPMRPPVGAPVLVTDDIARKKAQIALERMGLVRTR